jgi:hypothetical protein
MLLRVPICKRTSGQSEWALIGKMVATSAAMVAVLIGEITALSFITSSMSELIGLSTPYTNFLMVVMVAMPIMLLVVVLAFLHFLRLLAGDRRYEKILDADEDYQGCS